MNRVFPKFTGNVVPCNLPQRPQSCSESERLDYGHGWDDCAMIHAENRRQWRRFRRLATHCWESYKGPLVSGIVLGASAAYVVVCLLAAYTVWLGS